MYITTFYINLIMIFLAFSWHFWANTIAILGAMVFQTIVQPMIILNLNQESQSTGIGFLYFGIRYVIVNITFMHCLISVTGYLYVEAEIPRIGNEKLLNQLEEGVFIVDQASGETIFHNDAAKRVN